MQLNLNYISHKHCEDTMRTYSTISGKEILICNEHNATVPIEDIENYEKAMNQSDGQLTGFAIGYE